MAKKVYVMKSKSAYKIGVSKNPQIRLLELRTGNPDIELVYESEKTESAYAVEAKLHDIYSESRICGEWFLIDDKNRLIETVRNFVGEAVDIDTYGVSSEDKERKIQELLSWCLKPATELLSELCAEVSEIEKENRILSDQLKVLGWSDDEVEALIDEAVRNIT